MEIKTNKIAFFVLQNKIKKAKFNKKYAIACVFNKDRTKVKNILTGKIYKFINDGKETFIKINKSKLSQIHIIKNTNNEKNELYSCFSNADSYAYKLNLSGLNWGVFCDNKTTMKPKYIKNFVNSLNEDIHANIKKQNQEIKNEEYFNF